MFRNLLKVSVLFALAITMYCGLNSIAHAQDGHVVEYQLSSWKTLHFDSAEKADLHFHTVRGLGCEATKDAHGGHVDVSYRCEGWRRINLSSDESAHSWEHWLRASGFATKHDH